MATQIEVTQDVIYELSGEKVTMPADSIVQSSSELVGRSNSRGMMKPLRLCSQGLPRLGLSYGASRQITASQLQASTRSNWWSALKVSRLSNAERLK